MRYKEVSIPCKLTDSQYSNDRTSTLLRYSTPEIFENWKDLENNVYD